MLASSNLGTSPELVFSLQEKRAERMDLSGFWIKGVSKATEQGRTQRYLSPFGLSPYPPYQPSIPPTGPFEPNSNTTRISKTPSAKPMEEPRRRPYHRPSPSTSTPSGLPSNPRPGGLPSRPHARSQSVSTPIPPRNVGYEGRREGEWERAGSASVPMVRTRSGLSRELNDEGGERRTRGICSSNRDLPPLPSRRSVSGRSSKAEAEPSKEWQTMESWGKLRSAILKRTEHLETSSEVKHREKVGHASRGTHGSAGGEKDYSAWNFNKLWQAAEAARLWATGDDLYPSDKEDWKGESHLTRILKNYYVDKAKDPDDVPDWLFPEEELSLRRGGRMTVNAKSLYYPSPTSYDNEADFPKYRVNLKDIFETASSSSSADSRRPSDASTSVSTSSSSSNQGSVSSPRSYAPPEVSRGSSIGESRATSRLKALAESKRLDRRNGGGSYSRLARQGEDEKGVLGQPEAEAEASGSWSSRQAGRTRLKKDMISGYSTVC